MRFMRLMRLRWIGRALLGGLLAGCLAGAAPGAPLPEAALSFLAQVPLSEEVKMRLASCVSGDRRASEWTVEIGEAVYSLCAIPLPQNSGKSAFVQNSLRQDALNRAQLRALTRLALRLDGGRLDRKRFPNAEAADYALSVSYRGRLKGGLQSITRAIGDAVVGLVWVNRASLPAEPIPEGQITEGYCAFLYRRAQGLFNAGNFPEALAAFHQIHYMAWANAGAYLGASACFLQMGQPGDAGNLASEMAQVLSADMSHEETAAAARILYRSGRKDEGFAAMDRAYRMAGGGGRLHGGPSSLMRYTRER